MDKHDVMIAPSRMRLAATQRNDWVVNADHGTVLADIQTTAYFAHMADQLNDFDHIEVRAEDGSWIAYLLVLSHDRNWVKTKLLTHYELAGAGVMPSSSTKHEATWLGTQLKWGVKRISDGEKLKTGCKDKAEAEDWLRGHERTVA